MYTQGQRWSCSQTRRAVQEHDATLSWSAAEQIQTRNAVWNLRSRWTVTLTVTFYRDPDRNLDADLDLCRMPGWYIGNYIRS